MLAGSEPLVPVILGNLALTTPPLEMVNAPPFSRLTVAALGETTVPEPRAREFPVTMIVLPTPSAVTVVSARVPVPNLTVPEVLASIVEPDKVDI